MKFLKKILSALLVFAMALGIAQAAVPMTADAASVKSAGVKEYEKKIRIYPKDWDNNAIEMELSSSDYYLKAVKSSSANLKAKITKKTSCYSTDYNGKVTNNEAAGAVGLYAKKKGNYKVTVTIGKKSNKKFAKTVTVQVYAYDDYPFKSVKVNNKTDIYDQYYFSQKTLKFEVKAASGYKIKKIEVGTYKKTTEKDGNYDTELVWKTIKNGGKFKLGSVKDGSKYGYSSDYGSYKSFSNYIRSALAAETFVKVTYTDKYTKLADEEWFSFYYIKF